MAEIVFDHVSKVFDDGTLAVSDLNLTVNDGSLMVLVGPSGCGKTTSLRMVAGLEEVSAGEVRIGDRVVNEVAPKDRDIAMVFQNYALYPHMTVFENMAFGLRLRHIPKPEVNGRVDDTAKFLELYDLLRRKPGQLSGGQRQRVAMGRAIVREPKAFLMDEPLSNLDAKLRVQMRAELKRIHQRLGITTIYVTHDQVEAMTLGDRIVVMSNGRVQQIGKPQDVYRRPENLFVAGFIGSPPMNLLRGHCSDGRIRLGELELPWSGPDAPEVAVGLRPEDLRPARDGGPSLEFVVDVVEPLGNEVVVHGTTAGTAVESGAEEEAEIPLVAEGARAAITAVFEPADEPAPGERMRLGVVPERVHLFDLRTREAIGR